MQIVRLNCAFSRNLGRGDDVDGLGAIMRGILYQLRRAAPEPQQSAELHRHAHVHDAPRLCIADLEPGDNVPADAPMRRGTLGDCRA